MSSVPNMNDPYIKDLLIKFDVLKKALVEERKKTQSLEKKITEMQVYSSNKDKEIAEYVGLKTESIYRSLYRESNTLKSKSGKIYKLELVERQ